MNCITRTQVAPTAGAGAGAGAGDCALPRPASLRALLLAFALAFVLAAGILGGRPAHAADAHLYNALGGKAGVDALAATYIDRLATNPATRRSFAGSNLARIKRNLADELCELAGGPCRYASDPIRTVHANLGISEAEFFAGVQLLRDLMRERHVPLGTANELLALLAPMKPDVVDVKVAPPLRAAAGNTR